MGAGWALKGMGSGVDDVVADSGPMEEGGGLFSLPFVGSLGPDPRCSYLFAVPPLPSWLCQ